MTYVLKQPLTFIKTTKPRVDSENVCKKTTKVRTRQLGEHRHKISGGSKMLQLQGEIKACTPAGRGILLANLQQSGFKVTVPTDLASDLEADLNIPWLNLRT